MRRGLAPVVALLLSGTTAFAQDEAVIDLGPMLEAMTGTEPAPEPDGTETGAAPVDDPETAPGPAEELPEGEPEGPVTLPAYTRSSDTDVAEAAPVTVLQPFMTTPYRPILRVSGEFGQARLSLTLDDPAAVEELRVAVRTSIDVLPEQSRMTFLLNGTEIGSRAPDAFDDFAVIALPAEGLVAGENILEVQLSQTHRIFCGPEASFRIWTELDLSRSGAVVDSTALPGEETEAFRLALASQIATKGTVTVEAATPPDPALLADLRQRIGAVIPGAEPAIRVRSPYEPAGRAETARIALVGAPEPGLTLRTGGDGARVLVVGGRVGAGALDPWLARPTEMAGTAALVAGVPTPIADLGRDEITVASRYGREDVTFALPEDWLLLAGQTAAIELDYRYAEGLPEGALMLVKVNGTTVRLLPLFGEGNVDLPVLDVGFPARMLNPGPNAVSFEAIIPGDPPDLPCAPIAGPFVTIGGDTRLSVPESPRMSQPRTGSALRDLSVDGITAAAGGETTGIAAQVVAALGEGFRPVAGAGGASLTVAGLADAARAPLDAIGLERGTVEALLAPAGTAGGDQPDPGFVAGVADRLVKLAMPGDGPLSEWLAGRTALALVFLPDPDDPQTAWMIVAPGVRPGALATELSEARFDPLGPAGQAAILTPSGEWQSWQPRNVAPRLHEPVTFANFRTIAGNYASFSPLLFVAIISAFLIVSVVVALIFIVRTRGRRKR